MPPRTPLLRHLYSHIRFAGPISVAEYMRACLTHPVHGYYTTRPTIFGRDGDFVTAPQISQVFPELLAVWVTNFVRNTSLTAYDLVELGPGTGSLLATLLPTLTKLDSPPHQTTLLEASPLLRTAQKAALEKACPNAKVGWAESLDECLQSPRPTVFVAQEFLDALPVHVFHRRNEAGDKASASDADNWREQLVDIDATYTEENPELRFVLARAATPGNALLQLIRTKGKTVEVSGEMLSAVERISGHVGKHGGAALLIDYGSEDVDGSSIRALSKHAATDVLSAPGAHDVTADVNFGHVRDAVSRAQGAVLHGPVSQREFLLRLGAAERFRVLARSVVDSGGSNEEVDAKLDRLQHDYDRLVGDRKVGVGEGGMGEVYKVAAIAHHHDDVPFGFEHARNE